MSQTLAGKTALVTGGSRGIGRSIAERLAREGATVAVTYNERKYGADETVATIEKSGGTAFALQVDLADAESIPDLFERLDQEFTSRTGSNALNVLVNNAGNTAWGGIAAATPEAWNATFAVHARAPLFIAQTATSRLSDAGRIINISSGAATRPLSTALIYSAAKASVNSLTQALAIELGPRRITVNAVAPGWTRTDMNAAVRENAHMVAAIEADTTLGRFGEPEEIASVVAFLASEEGRWVTGQVIEASGGFKL
ncbi:SDR family NAD(P)-dependent oxidoreductase [Catenuloplanes sp. NPDC051500]|uniref:SDR family NAD(P)-dependent oxidoreductase n=1 Tax=Catenuloplanes sp. NPDC051500 TaxID=3363959 RepID=UPI00378A33C4